MILSMPTFSDDSYTEAVTLDGTTYNFQFDFNQRCASWYMHIADQDGVDIYNGVKLVTGFELLNKCKDRRKPAGGLFVVSSTSDLTPPDMFDLVPGGRCKFIYVTSDWHQMLLSAARGEMKIPQGPPGMTVDVFYRPLSFQQVFAQLMASIDANATASAVSTYGQTPTG